MTNLKANIHPSPKKKKKLKAKNGAKKRAKTKFKKKIFLPAIKYSRMDYKLVGKIFSTPEYSTHTTNLPTK